MRHSLALGLVACVLGAGPAHAGLSVCNKSALSARVAMGRFDGTHWISEGWWSVAPKTCTALIAGALKARYYYLYASDGAAGVWDGNTHFCTAPKDRFTIETRGNCAAEGNDRRGFFEVDTGKSPDWTQTIQ